MTDKPLKNTSQLIDDLIRHWAQWDKYEEFYLKELAPRLAADPEAGDETERAILRELWEQGSWSELISLPELIAERRAAILREGDDKRLSGEWLRQEAKRIWRCKQNAKNKAAERKNNVLAELRRLFEVDFLGAEEFFKRIPKYDELSGSESEEVLSAHEFHIEKQNFIRNWMESFLGSRTAYSALMPDEEQLAAIAAVNGSIQVVARAGSGKTATLVYRTLFLISHCRVDPAQILLLAFNRKAAFEIRRRLLLLLHSDASRLLKVEIDDARSQRGDGQGQHTQSALEALAMEAVAKRLGISLPHIMTFHALAYSIVHPEEALLHDGVDKHGQGLSRIIQGLIDDLIRSDQFYGEVSALMMAHFKTDWDRIVSGGFDKSKTEIVHFRRMLPMESIRGELVKSRGEKFIADFLLENGVPYKYERNHYWGEVNYRPDFTIFKTAESGVIIEYFGLEGDSDYDNMSAMKRAYWAQKPDWDLIEVTAQDVAGRSEDSLAEYLKVKLSQYGVMCRPLTEEEIWCQIRERAIDRFTRAVVTFIGRCRKQAILPDELFARVALHSALSSAETRFLKLAAQIYAKYFERIRETGEDDFDGLMLKAAELLNAGRTHFHRKSGSGDIAQLKHVCVDEFQDFSELFHRLLLAMRAANPGLDLFCVGDDWQAINGFAGSELRFFNNFSEYFTDSKKLQISTNYRSGRAIVSAGNALMYGRGNPAMLREGAAGVVLLADMASFQPTVAERQRYQGDIITPAVSRIVQASMASGTGVALLSRRQTGLPWFVHYKEPGQRSRGIYGFLDLIKAQFSEESREQVTISTAHGYKGLERTTVIIVDAVARSYPLIHPDWLFYRIIGETPQKILDEERRLFYVAITRAVEKLVLITDAGLETNFLAEIKSKYELPKLNWADYPPVQNVSQMIIVRVDSDRTKLVGGGTFAIKDQLKACGYRWTTGDWRGWVKMFPATRFSVDRLLAEVWARSADGVEVRMLDEHNMVLAKYLVSRGKWQRIFDNLES